MLKTLDEPGREFAGGIQFTMIDGIIRIVCWITREALDRIEGGNNPPPAERINRFNRHRVRIEQLASEKHAAGEHSPVVMSFDLGRLH